MLPFNVNVIGVILCPTSVKYLRGVAFNLEVRPNFGCMHFFRSQSQNFVADTLVGHTGPDLDADTLVRHTNIFSKCVTPHTLNRFR